MPGVGGLTRAAVLVLAAAGFVSFKLSDALSGTPLIWQDSLLYEKVAHSGWFTAGLWTGERAPLIPVLWKLTGTPTTFVAVQTCFSIVCWSALALAVARVTPGVWWRVVAAVVVLALATTAPVRLWDHSVLSETMALACLALMTSLLVLTAQRPTRLRIAGTALAGLGFAATRDTGIFTVLVLGFAFGIYAVRRPRQVRWRALGLACALVAAAGLPLGLQMASGRSNLNVRNNYYVRVFPYKERVGWFADRGMPEADQVNQLALAQDTPPGHAAVVAPDMNDPSFAPLYAWIRTDGARTYLAWLATHPGYVVTAPFDRPVEAFNNDDGTLSFYAGAETSTRWLDKSFDGPWWYAMAIAVFALLIAILAGVTRTREWQLAVLLTATGAASVLAAWHGDGQEVTRHTVEGDVQLRLGLLIALLVSLPAWWRRYRVRA